MISRFAGFGLFSMVPPKRRALVVNSLYRGSGKRRMRCPNRRFRGSDEAGNFLFKGPPLPRRLSCLLFGSRVRPFVGMRHVSSYTRKTDHPRARWGGQDSRPGHDSPRHFYARRSPPGMGLEQHPRCQRSVVCRRITTFDLQVRGRVDRSTSSLRGQFSLLAP